MLPDEMHRMVYGHLFKITAGQYKFVLVTELFNTFFFGKIEKISFK